MDPATTSALTAVFIGAMWALISVVRFFLKTRKEENAKPVVITLSKEQSDMLVDIHTHVSKLDEMHAVYDDNRVPKWYVPGDLLTLVRETHNLIENLAEDMENIQSGQAMSVDRISELVNSTKLMTERLGDLITMWSKNESK